MTCSSSVRDAPVLLGGRARPRRRSSVRRRARHAGDRRRRGRSPGSSRAARRAADSSSGTSSEISTQSAPSNSSRLKISASIDGESSTTTSTSVCGLKYVPGRTRRSSSSMRRSSAMTRRSLYRDDRASHPRARAAGARPRPRRRAAPCPAAGGARCARRRAGGPPRAGPGSAPADGARERRQLGLDVERRLARGASRRADLASSIWRISSCDLGAAAAARPRLAGHVEAALAAQPA